MNNNQFSNGYDKNEEIKNLKRRIINLESQLEIERSISQNLRGGNLLQTEPIDFYPGEQLDFILSLLEQAKFKCAENSRPYDIICSILSQNKPIGNADKITNELNKIFSKGDSFSEKDIAAMERMGFKYTPSRKHPKLRFHEKYMFVLASTPGDTRRGNKNKLSEINKCIAAGIKI